jgi:hypothetical protein
VNLESLLDRFVRACLDVFGQERVEGIVLHGSALKGGAIPGYSDVDFIVFLAPDCFDERGALPDESVFAIQERIGPLPWREAGFLDPQAYFYDARRLPSWWTGPVPGAYRVLCGRLPPEAAPTPEGLRSASRHFLKEELPRHIAWSLRNFADADDASLPRRVRLLGTDVTPAIFALAGHDAEDVLELWAQPKFEALARLEERYPEAEGPTLARRFFEGVRRLYDGEFDGDLGRETFRTGIAFLRWAEAVASASGGLPEPPAMPPRAT